MTAGRVLCACVKRVAGGLWQAVNISQTRHFMKNKYCFTGVRKGKGEDALGEEQLVKAGKAWHNMDVWWMVGDSMSGSTEDMGDGVGGEPAVCVLKGEPSGPGLDFLGLGHR